MSRLREIASQRIEDDVSITIIISHVSAMYLIAMDITISQTYYVCVFSLCIDCYTLLGVNAPLTIFRHEL